ncbi:MAG TPA: alpha/beta hydrolase [Gammaproteobacteria bacterium]|jgi:2-hydroxy-6-oxonona-2,4-dienedioate hydrolase/2-succinyl-6-hydroxy-2,4-cyclohexadiene-1-carboxylate synthase|nr:alpha/beta hydrolase [Gammaproteobacteria bacterium]
MPKALVNGLNIHYVQVGKGPHLVLIHGIASNLGQWQLSILPTLVENFRVTMYDLRGHGYSDMPPRGYTPDHMVGDFGGLMDYLTIRRSSILGHSYGGLVALYYAALHPERVDKLIIADTGVPSLEPEERRDAALVGWIEALRRQGIEVPEEKTQDVTYLMEQTLRLRGRRRAGMGVQRAIARLSRFFNTTSFDKEYREHAGITLEMIRQIQTPVLLIYGDHSPNTASFQFLRKNLPNCRTVMIPDGGHFYPLEHPETFVRYTEGFLQEPSNDPKDRR